MIQTDSISAPAKVNLFLHVGAAQTNGRHPLDSLVMFATPPCADVLRVSHAPTLNLSITGNTGDLAGDDDNLILRAAHALRAATGHPDGADFVLDKRLPIAAGIGGGSADAAAALHLLCDLWDVDLAIAEAVAPQLGGDVPACLARRPVLMRGEGERLETPPKVPNLHAILVNPNVPCPTGQVFAAFDMGGGGEKFYEQAMPYADSAGALMAWLAADTRNDLEAAAITVAPEVANVLTALRALPNVRLSRMSGSGATCFALFDTADDAAIAAQALNDAHTGWWIAPTVLGGG